MPDFHPLDRPIWTSLTTRWAELAMGDADAALRLPAPYWPLAATPAPTGRAAALLGAFVQPGEALAVFDEAPIAAVEGLTADHLGIGQMVATEILGPEPQLAWRSLGEADAAEMLALAEETKPGPFSIATWRLGAFIGVHDEGRLVAMAGERMGAPGFGELSGLCTAPTHQGRGLGAGLLRIVGRRILARGEAVFLHVHTRNTPAAAMYERLGFSRRTEFVHTTLRRPAAV